MLALLQQHPIFKAHAVFLDLQTHTKDLLEILTYSKAIHNFFLCFLVCFMFKMFTSASFIFLLLSAKVNFFKCVIEIGILGPGILYIVCLKSILFFSSVYIYVYMCVCMHTYICMCIYICIYACLTWTRMCTHIHMLTHVCI